MDFTAYTTDQLKTLHNTALAEARAKAEAARDVREAIEARAPSYRGQSRAQLREAVTSLYTAEPSPTPHTTSQPIRTPTEPLSTAPRPRVTLGGAREPSRLSAARAARGGLATLTAARAARGSLAALGGTRGTREPRDPRRRARHAAVSRPSAARAARGSLAALGGARGARRSRDPRRRARCAAVSRPSRRRARRAGASRPSRRRARRCAARGGTAPTCRERAPLFAAQSRLR